MSTPITQIRNWIKLSLTNPDIFGSVVNRIETHFEQSAAGMAELKGRSTKSKGELWEAFCLLYLRAIAPTAQVYLLKDVPAEVKTALKLPKPDLGIDIVFINNGGAVAVQCKYRHCTKRRSLARPHGKTYVKYADLATFIALCSMTGPWVQHLVMTNCDGVSWKKLKSAKDVTYAKGTFIGSGLTIWTHMAGSEGHSLTASTDEHKPSTMTREQLAAYRASRYAKT